MIATIRPVVEWSRRLMRTLGGMQTRRHSCQLDGLERCFFHRSLPVSGANAAMVTPPANSTCVPADAMTLSESFGSRQTPYTGQELSSSPSAEVIGSAVEGNVAIPRCRRTAYRGRRRGQQWLSSPGQLVSGLIGIERGPRPLRALPSRSTKAPAPPARGSGG